MVGSWTICPKATEEGRKESNAMQNFRGSILDMKQTTFGNELRLEKGFVSGGVLLGD